MRTNRWNKNRAGAINTHWGSEGKKVLLDFCVIAAVLSKWGVGQWTWIKGPDFYSRSQETAGNYKDYRSVQILKYLLKLLNIEWSAPLFPPKALTSLSQSDFFPVLTSCDFEIYSNSKAQSAFLKIWIWDSAAKAASATRCCYFEKVRVRCIRLLLPPPHQGCCCPGDRAKPSDLFRSSS